MNKGTPGIRRAVVGGLTALLAVATLVPLATSAGAVAGFNFTRLAGEDRWQTAARIAANTFPNGSDTVLLARGEADPQLRSFADALAGNGLAGARNVPILLTHPTILPDSTRAAFTQLGARTVIILGGEEAVSRAVADAVATALGTGGTVRRIGGIDRFETAALIAREMGGTGGANVGNVDGLRTAIVATGLQFPDPLAGGAVAFANRVPVLLTRPDVLPASTLAVLRDFNIQQVLLLGGPEAVSVDVEGSIRTATTNGIRVVRIGGTDRHDTARLIAEFAIREIGFSVFHVNVARSDDFADALSGGPHAGRERAPILLTPPTVASDAACEYLLEHSDTLQNGHIYGGLFAVTADAEAQLAACAQGVVGNQTFPMSPQGTTFRNVNENMECRTFVPANTTVDIALFPTENVFVSQSGIVVFQPATTPTTQAEQGTTPARITSTQVGNATPTVTNAQRVEVASGANASVVTFTFTSPEPDDVIAVVWQDADNDNQLDLNEQGQPTEAFGVGCRTVFLFAGQQGTQQDVVHPVINDARILVDTPTAGVTGTVSAGDQWRLTFSEPLGDTADDAGQSIFISDQNGDSFPLTCVAPGGTAFRNPVTCELTAGNTELVVTILENPNAPGLVPVSCGPGFDPAVFPPCVADYPVDVVDLSSGFADPAGNQVNLPASPDRRVDQE